MGVFLERRIAILYTPLQCGKRFKYESVGARKHITL